MSLRTAVLAAQHVNFVARSHWQTSVRPTSHRPPLHLTFMQLDRLPSTPARLEPPLASAAAIGKGAFEQSRLDVAPGFTALACSQ
jgi:hypothetical protein